jgi:5-methylcytosine-specific restriction endonuclease McrA
MRTRKWQDKEGKFKKGVPSWNKGKSFSQKTKSLWSKIREGKHNSLHTEFKKGMAPWNKGKTGCFKHTEEWMIDNCGENHPNWKGGITPLNDQIRHSFEYRQWRSDVFTKDNFTCQECGETGGNGKTVYLEAHHIKRFYIILKEYGIKTLEAALACAELWNINNGKTLCKKCHDILRGRD